MTELNPDQRDVVGQLITSFANQNRVARKREPYTVQMKPVFFQVAQAQKAPPPVTQAVSLTLMVVFTLGAQGLQSQPYVSVTCSAASCAILPTACLTIDATTDATTADDAATSVHTTFHLAKRHVRTGGPPKKSKVTIALAWATLASQTVSAPNKMGGATYHLVNQW